MPYIPTTERTQAIEIPYTPGHLNYLLTRNVMGYLRRKGTLKYEHLNEVMGVLESVKQEFYRRVVVPYEQEKIETNGDVFD